MEHIPHTRHRPICARANPIVAAHPTPFRKRFNLQKADWDSYSTELDKPIKDAEPIPENYGGFVDKVRRTFTNNKKADWTQFTEDTEFAFAQTTIPTNIHNANRFFTSIILMADKHNIPKGKMHNNCRLLPKT